MSRDCAKSAIIKITAAGAAYMDYATPAAVQKMKDSIGKPRNLDFGGDDKASEF